MRPAKTTTIIVEIARIRAPVINCQSGIVAPVANRITIMVAVAGGKNDMEIANVPFGS